MMVLLPGYYAHRKGLEQALLVELLRVCIILAIFGLAASILLHLRMDNTLGDGSAMCLCDLYDAPGP